MKSLLTGPRNAASLLFLALASAARTTPTLSVVSAFRIDDLRTSAFGVNATGQVVGSRAYTVSVTTTGGKSRTIEGIEAYVTDADGLVATDVLPITGTGIATAGPCRGSVYSDVLSAINASGEAVGTSTVSITVGTKTTVVPHAVLYSGGTLTDLGALGTPPSASVAVAINASGVVVGTSEVGAGKHHAFSSNGTTLTDLGTLGGKSSDAAGISDSGTIVGGSSLSNGVVHPFSYAGGTMADLGLPTGFVSASATAISASGIVVGTGEPTPARSSGKKRGAPHAPQSFVLNGTAFTNLGSLYTDKQGNATPVFARGVNSDGIVVGDTFDAKGKPRGFVFSGGTLTDLTTLLPTTYSTYTVMSATAISDGGYVSAIAVDGTSGKQYALLLKLG